MRLRAGHTMARKSASFRHGRADVMRTCPNWFPALSRCRRCGATPAYSRSSRRPPPPPSPPARALGTMYTTIAASAGPKPLPPGPAAQRRTYDPRHHQPDRRATRLRRCKCVGTVPALNNCRASHPSTLTIRGLSRAGKPRQTPHIPLLSAPVRLF